jgi:hypothetical protein
MTGSRGVCFWRESGARQSDCVRAFGRDVASAAVKMFSCLI